MSVVKAGDNVMLQFDETTFAFVNNIQPNSRVKTRKKHFFNGEMLIGQPYGALFEQREQKLLRVAERPNAADLLVKAKGHGEDNRNLSFASDAQKLSQEDIEAMKSEGKAAGDIITALMENSATMESKTAFAQEKWIKKKLAKYSVVFTVVAPSGMAVARALWHRDCQRILSLRWDALAWMLTAADLRSGSRPLVVDGCTGLLTGAVMERLYGQAECVTSVYEAGGPPNHVLSFFNFPDAVRNNAKFVKMATFLSGVDAETAAAPRYDSLLMAVDHDPTALTKRVWPLLATGGVFVCFSVYVEAIKELVGWVRADHVAVDYRVVEIFYREHQVLPGRSHPNMQMNSASGFVLSMIKVDPLHNSRVAAQVEAFNRVNAARQNPKGKRARAESDAANAAPTKRADTTAPAHNADDEDGGVDDE